MLICCRLCKNRSLPGVRMLLKDAESKVPELLIQIRGSFAGSTEVHVLRFAADSACSHCGHVGT